MRNLIERLIAAPFWVLGMIFGTVLGAVSAVGWLLCSRLFVCAEGFMAGVRQSLLISIGDKLWGEEPTDDKRSA